MQLIIKLSLVNLGFFMCHIYWSVNFLFYTLREMFFDLRGLLVGN